MEPVEARGVAQRRQEAAAAAADPLSVALARLKVTWAVGALGAPSAAAHECSCSGFPVPPPLAHPPGIPPRHPVQAGRPPRSPDRPHSSGAASGGGSGGDLQQAARQLRQSSDSTLHPPPSGRPSSAPSGRSSFDSCVEGPSSDPSRSQRSSLEGGSAASPAPPHPSAAAAVGAPGAEAAAVAACDTECSLCRQGDGAVQPGSGGGGRGYPGVDLRRMQPAGPRPHSSASPFASAANSLQAPGAQPAAAADEPLASPFGQALSASEVSFPALPSGNRPRRRSVGKHPANLEHGSTAPPGAVDALTEALLAAAATAQQPGGSATAAAGGHPAGGGAGSSAAGPSAAARFAVPRRSAGGLPPTSPPTEPLLSSQVALLAQQLLLHRQQVSGATAGTAAAQLRRSLQLQESWPGPGPGLGQPLAAGQRPLGRSRTVAAEELLAARGRTGAPSAAQQLLLSGGGSGGGELHFPAASRGLQSLNPAHQPRCSAPTSPPSEEASPFSAVQGAQRACLRAVLPAWALALPGSLACPLRCAAGSWAGGIMPACGLPG